MADLTDEQLLGPQLAIVNPGVWEIGHHAWFQSRWVLRHAGGQPPVRDDEDDLYDSIAIAHDRRWDLPLPSRDGTLAYVREVLDRTERLLLADPPDDGVIYHALYSVLHEDMHTEALTYTRQTHGWPAPPGWACPAPRRASAAAAWREMSRSRAAPAASVPSAASPSSSTTRSGPIPWS